MTHPTDDELEEMASRLSATLMPNKVSPQDQAIIYNLIDAADLLRACKGRGRVKPLEWDDLCAHEFKDKSGRIHCRATGLHGFSYTIYETLTDGIHVTYSYGGFEAYVESVEAAKAAAQADYEARILSVFEPAPDHAEWNAALEAAAKVSEKPMLPCDVGGDLCIDPYSSETIATAIRNLKKGGPMTDPDTSAEGVERLAAWLESHADYSEALDTAATLRARWKARTEAAEAERDTQRAQKLAAWGLVDEATEILRDLCWCKERRTTMDAVREHARAFLVSREDEERG